MSDFTSLREEWEHLQWPDVKSIQAVRPFVERCLATLNAAEQENRRLRAADPSLYKLMHDVALLRALLPQAIALIADEWDGTRPASWLARARSILRETA
jgi:hypothetical protein